MKKPSRDSLSSSLACVSLRLLLPLIAATVCLFPVARAVRGMRVDYSRTCEPIRVEACQGLGYNVTAMPNFGGHESQLDAELQIQTFAPLIQYGCSSQLRFFLCSVYVPMCTEKVADNIGPCRPLCASVKERCHPILVEFGFPWPSSLDCERFPEENNHLHMCMEGPGEELDAPPAPVKPAPMPAPTERPAPTYYGPGLSVSGKKPAGVGGSVAAAGADRKKQRPSDSLPTAGAGDSLRDHSFAGATTPANSMCSMYRHASEYFYVNRTDTCSHKCASDILFSSENKDFAETWLLIWSIVCLLTTAFALYTFLADAAQFRYPERIIVIMAFTHFMFALGHVVRLALGREAVSCHTESQHNVSLLITEGPDNLSCTLVFVVTYFFGMASALWWVNLTIAWFLSAGLNWSAEAIERRASYFHFSAWLIPSLKTLAILIMREVDADELTGSCFVGSHANGTLLAFVIIPSSFYLLLGSFFLFARLYCFYLAKQVKTCTSLRVRHASHHSSASSSHHSASGHLSAAASACCNPKDMQALLDCKINLFTLFYMVPAFFQLAFHVYEYLERDTWYLSGSPDRPNFEMFTIRIFMNFVVGIQSGLWIWSLKTSAGGCGQMCSRFRHCKPVAHTKPTYLMTLPAVSPVTTLPSAASSSMGGLSTLPPHYVRYQQQQQGSQQLFSTLDKNNRQARGLGKGGETTV